jgi:hypothetical protein
MHNILRGKHSPVLAILLGLTLAFSVFSNVYASSILTMPISHQEVKLSSPIVAMDEDDHSSDIGHGKENGNKNGNGKDQGNEGDRSDNGNGKKNGHTKNIKIKAKHDGGSVEIEEDETERASNGKQFDSKNDDMKSFPSDFVMDADGGIAVQRNNEGGKSKRFDDVSIELSASTSRLEGNHIRVSVDGEIMLGDDEFEITDGHGIIIFFKNPNSHFFRGIIHIAGVAVNVDDESEKKFHLRAILLPGGEEEDEGVWSFVAAPSAKLGSDIRIFRLVGELIALDDIIPTPNSKLNHFAVSTINSPVTAGQLFNVTVTALTSDNKTLKTYDGKALISDLSGTVKPETTTKFHEGVFKGLLNITKSLTSDKLTFVDIASSKKGTSNAFNVLPGSVVKVDLAPSAIKIKPDEKTKFTAKGLDKFGNEISSLSFSWSLSSPNVGSISTSANKANFTASSSIASVANATLTATIQGGTLKDTSMITILPETELINHFEIENVTSPKTAGVPFQITIKAVNATGGTITTYGGPITLIDTTGSLNMTVSSGFSNGVWTGNVNITKAESGVKITAKDAINPAKKGTSNAFNVVPSSLAKIDLTPSAITLHPAQNASFTAKGKDKFGNEILASGITFTWSLSSSDFGSIATSGNNATFSASSTIVDETNITLTAKVGAIHDDSIITIKSIASQLLDHLVINEIPNPTKAGLPFSLTLTAVGATGAAILSYSSPIDLTDTTGTLSVVTNNGFSNGVWTGKVKITKASVNAKITVEAKETPNKKGTSNAFEVKAGDIDHFEISETGHQQTAGIEFSLIAKAMDAFGNKVTDYDGTVILSTNDGTSPAGNASELAPSPYPFNSDDEGQHTFQAKLYNAKSGVTITISSSGKSGTSNTFDVVPSITAKVIISPHSISVPQGEELDFKAKAQDAFGNIISGTTFDWTLSSTLLGTLESISGSVVEFKAPPVVIENITGSLTAKSGAISNAATITVTTS